MSEARSRAFTLVEILVAVAILSLLLLLLFAFAGQVNKIFLQGLAGNERRGNDRALLDFIATELRLAVVPHTPFLASSSAALCAMMPDSTNSFQFVIDPAGISAVQAQSVFWQAPIATDRSAGVLAEVGYYVGWSGNAASLRRFFANPGTTNYLIYSNPGRWITDGLLAAAAPADAAHHYQGLFAQNVFAFWARALDSEGKPIVTAADGTAYAPYAYDSRRGYIDNLGGIHPPSSLPAMVEIAIVAADARTARLLSQPYPASATTPDAFWADIDGYAAAFPAPVRSGIHVYGMRVALGNAR